MKKFIITEEEKGRILNMYNLISEEPVDPAQDIKKEVQNITTLAKQLSSKPNTQTPLSQFTKDMAKIYGIPEEECSSLEALNDNLDSPTRTYYYDLFRGQMDNLTNSVEKIRQSGKFDEFFNQLKSYNGQMTKSQKLFLANSIEVFKSYKNVSLKSNQQGQTLQQNQGEKINTTNDKSYDYKLSGGKYYYSRKGQNQWIESKGKGLEAIKTKIKF